MYASCIFCSAALGANDALPHFPVGSRLAFDAARGRLWAVCPRCARWNLAPIEERWEAVEEAERAFRDARMRVQSENVGLARLPDGTSLVRVGAAVPGEMAAWRYGRQLVQRRRRYIAGTGIATAAGLAVFGGAAALGVSAGIAASAASWLRSRREQRVIFRVPPEPGESGKDASASEVLVRRWHVQHFELLPPTSDAPFDLLVRDGRRERPGSLLRRAERAAHDDVLLRGDTAHAALARAMVHFNRSGASESALHGAHQVLASAGSAEQVLRDAAARRSSLSDKAAFHARALARPTALALEMALNEEAERHALEGELAALEAAWKEAEEIAAIADALPGEAALNRVLDRLAR